MLPTVRLCAIWGSAIPLAGRSAVGKVGVCDSGFLNGPNDRRNTNTRIAALASNGGPTHTHALLADSPAINAGNNQYAPPLDQRGSSRLGASDIGAFEFGGGTASLALLSVERIGNGSILLSVRGIPSGVHRIQASSDLSQGSFSDIDTATADALGRFQYEDDSGLLTRRCYRIVFP